MRGARRRQPGMWRDVEVRSRERCAISRRRWEVIAPDAIRAGASRVVSRQLPQIYVREIARVCCEERTIDARRDAAREGVVSRLGMRLRNRLGSGVSCGLGSEPRPRSRGRSLSSCLARGLSSGLGQGGALGHWRRERDRERGARARRRRARGGAGGPGGHIVAGGARLKKRARLPAPGISHHIYVSYYST